MLDPKFIKVSQPVEHEFIGIISEPGAGKTTFACQFPNPLILDFDRKAPNNIQTIPFYDDAFCRAITKQSINPPPNRRDALTTFLRTQAKDLADHTIILDSWTMMQAAFDEYTEYEKPRDGGKDAAFSFFRKKIEFSEAVCTLLRAIPTTSLVLVHEMPERNDEGTLTGKIKPYMDGKFADAMAGRFTDFIRLCTNPVDAEFDTGKPKKGADGQPLILRENGGRYLQMTPNRIFTPVLGHNKTDYITAHKLSYVKATYKDWHAMSTFNKQASPSVISAAAPKNTIPGGPATATTKTK